MTDIYYKETDVVEKIKYYVENKNSENLNNLAKYCCELNFESEDEKIIFLDVCDRELKDGNVLELLLAILKIRLK
ncbi:hypothetical protein [Pantoea brenneri]|jgi:hypothetical protein|uniref:Uncharacterized protein n=1 Tax=Pantoea brenneri TaxID=472694 RepID=A0A7Y6TUL8_9GAMM|nr:hypothetical protein [Pantoea brenneri]NUY44560.1 hypothetical protein [Pantoea brenneri]NUY52058.1 hypothetical protein [Pantoea brenneri]NUY62388.1 hypothetical protein [Pantoea brenneri]NUY67036.1 hypothetical protein [Pantoea brenneri]NUY74595.1 hypothetical protein [Pantoea brenneri]